MEAMKPSNLDQLDEQVDQLLVKLNALPRWTKEKHALHEQVRAFLTASGYSMHVGKTASFYNVTGIGSETVEHIPSTRRGALGACRGQIVRIICIGSGRYERTYAVGPTSKTPVTVDQMA